MANLKSFEKAVPTGPLKICGIPGSEGLAEKVNAYMVDYRKTLLKEYPEKSDIKGLYADSFIIPCDFPRFGSGEGKAVLKESVRGCDLFIIADMCNPTVTYKQFGMINHMSPDDHFQNLKRVIAASVGKAHRVNVIMPFLYEGRQHRRTARESLDCAIALKELANMGVENIITFDAHDPRVMNSIPLCGFDNFFPNYQFLCTLLECYPDAKLDNDHLRIISPDEGAMPRAIYMASVLGVEVGMFYKRRDYSVIVNGKNPIIAHEYIGDSVEGKDCIVMDDMISSGGSMLDVASQLKERGANRVIVCTTFGLFAEGLDIFDKYYEKGLFSKVITTDLIYQSPELLSRPWYATAKMDKYLASIIDTANHDMSVDHVRDHTAKITQLMDAHQSK